MEAADVSLEGTWRLLRGFPGLGDVLEGASRIINWTARDILAPFGAEPSTRGRITSTGRISEWIPCLSPHMAESAFTNALLLRCSLADKGLTPAALRDFEGLGKGHGPRMGMDREATEVVDWLGVWGLSKSTPPKAGLRPTSGVGQKLGTGMCDVTFARGLKSAMPTSGMGWRIMS